MPYESLDKEKKEFKSDFTLWYFSFVENPHEKIEVPLWLLIMAIKLVNKMGFLNIF